MASLPQQRRLLPLQPLLLALLTGAAVAADDEWPSGHARALRKKLNDGTVMPMVGLGTWKSQAHEVGDAVYHAICEGGYRHIDAAQIYSNQEEVGGAIRGAMKDCGVKREDLWVTSKVWPTDFHPEHVPASVDRILRELGLDYVDQVLLHWPVPFAKPPPNCPPDCPAHLAGTDDPMRPRGVDGGMVHADISLAETWKALEQAKAAGKVRSIGVSNFNLAEIKSLGGSTLPAVNQVEMHVFWNQAFLRYELRKLGIDMVAYTPLGNPGVYKATGEDEGMGAKLVEEIAADSGLTPAQVMLNYLLALDIIVIPKSVTPARISSNIDFDLKLTDGQIARLLLETPQRRLANPKIRPGGQHVFDDSEENEEL